MNQRADLNPPQGASDAARSETEAEALRLKALRRIEYLLAGLLLLFFFWSISLAKVVVLPIVLGFLIALTLSPLVRWLARIGIPTGISAVTIIFTIGIGSALGLYLLSGPASTLMDSMPAIQREAEAKLGHLADKVRQVQEAEKNIQDMASGEREAATDSEVTTILVDDPSMLETAVASAAGTGTALIIALLLAMFLLASGDMFQHKLVQSFDRFGDKKKALRISHDIERQISRYLGAITVINLCLGVAIGGAMYLLGVPYPIIWGLAAFLLNYLPYLGAIVGMLAVAAVSLITFNSVGEALVPPLVYFMLTSIEGQMVTPVLVGRHLSLNAAAVFVAVIFWAWLWGVAGALMAVPFLVFVKVVGDNIPALDFVSRFLSGADPDPGEEA
ncbi:AI-2E family transporter [Pseudooceanicola sp. C21-150M6]|uniref:AI-2E family transporter n=1 Tax=Pseudooceanicola sp. C21-150M6 TaxID=3434355 RepID=UPI003D7F216E